jgi:hypothetical protein
MRSPAFFLVVSLAVVLSVGYLLLTGPRGNWGETEFVTAVFVALLPLIVTAVIAAVAAVRRHSAPFPPRSRMPLLLWILLIVSTLWMFFIVVGISVSAA